MTATTTQVFTIISIICAPMVTIGMLVLILAALNLSLGVRRLYVKLLAIIFDYATKIKRDKEISNDPDVSTEEPPTPAASDDKKIDEPMPAEHKVSKTSSQSDIQFKLGKKRMFAIVYLI